MSSPHNSSRLSVSSSSTNSIHVSINFPSYSKDTTEFIRYKDNLYAQLTTKNESIEFREANIMGLDWILGQPDQSLLLSADRGGYSVRHLDLKIAPTTDTNNQVTFLVAMYIGKEVVCTESIQMDPKNTQSVVVNFKDDGQGTKNSITAQSFITSHPYFAGSEPKKA